MSKRTATKKTKSGTKISVKILWSAFFISLGLCILVIIAADFGWLGKMPSIEEF